MGNELPNLEAILLGQNNLTGFIPNSISNAPALTRLSLVANKLSGPIPSSLGELRFLDFLNLGENNFGTDSPELSFIISLTNCRLLRVIWIQNNSFSGYLPVSIGNLSYKLETIDASNSVLRGSIPQQIGNISNLNSLFLDNNDLTGFIPSTIKGIQNLQALSLIGNSLNGVIPDDICTLTKLEELTLSKNKLHGPLPRCIVSDFGIAKLVNADDTLMHTKTLATFGYIAPEYGLEGLVSRKCDAYSYWIVLMETFTRMRPSDDLFTGGMSLRGWVKVSYPDSIRKVVDPNLLKNEKVNSSKIVECVSLIMKLALDCSAESPGKRTNMTEALATLQKIKSHFLLSNYN